MRVPKFILSFLLVLVLLVIPNVESQGGGAPPPPTTEQYYPIQVPIGVGIASLEGRNVTEGFGLFHQKFTKCGQSTPIKVPELNPGFVTPANSAQSITIFVHCEPSPTRVLLTSDDKQQFDAFKRDFKEECELFTCSNNVFEAKDTEIEKSKNTEAATIKKSVAPKPIPANTMICGDKKPEYMTASAGTKVVFAEEGDCYSDPKTPKNTKLRGLVEAADSKWFHFPRWIEKEKNRFNARTFMFSDEKPENTERVPYAFTRATHPTPIKYEECDTTCDRGTVVVATMPHEEDRSWHSMIYLDSSKCSSFRICFDPENHGETDRIPECRPDYTIDVLFKNGVIVWGKKGRASVLEMMSNRNGGGDVQKLVAIEFGFGEPETNAKQFYVGNVYREYVSSDSGGYNASTASKLAFFFPVDDCLMLTAGISSKFIVNARTLTNNKKNLERGQRFNASGSPLTGGATEAWTTTTEAPIIDIISTTTPAALRANADPNALIGDAEHLSSAVYSAGKWWTWGVYFGFVVGTVLTLGVGGGLFYVLRRTIFSIWYRGMYKRYGCDVSGTTGGITGIGFGNTTAMTETIAAGATGNTMGGTTGGASTMGTTGGGNETTGTSTTGGTTGTSTLAM